MSWWRGRRRRGPATLYQYHDRSSEVASSFYWSSWAALGQTSWAASWLIGLRCPADLTYQEGSCCCCLMKNRFKYFRYRAYSNFHFFSTCYSTWPTCLAERSLIADRRVSAATTTISSASGRVRATRCAQTRQVANYPGLCCPLLSLVSVVGRAIEAVYRLCSLAFWYSISTSSGSGCQESCSVHHDY